MQKHLLSRRRRDGDEFLERIDYIQEGLRETRKRMLKFGAGRAEFSPQYVEEMSPCPWQGGEDVVGLEEDVAILLLQDENVRTATTCIWGMCGIGKTTLARPLYNHPTIVDQFECRAWVCVSRELSRKELLMKLIWRVLGNKAFDRDATKMESADNKTLQQKLHHHLRGKRFFIVLDDVPEDTYLKYVFEALPDEEGMFMFLAFSMIYATLLSPT